MWPLQIVFNATGPFIVSITCDPLENYTMIFVIFASLVMVASVLMFSSKPPGQHSLAFLSFTRLKVFTPRTSTLSAIQIGVRTWPGDAG